MQLVSRTQRVAAGGLGLLLAVGLRCALEADAVPASATRAVPAEASGSKPTRLPPPSSTRREPPSAAAVAELERKPGARHALDLDLLAEIASRTGAPPSASALRLVALHERGASSAELRRAITQDLEPDLRVQVAARRWLRRSAGEPQPTAAMKPPARGALRHVQPLQKAQHPGALAGP